MIRDYLHGYTPDEQKRLIHQARFLERFIYKGIDFSNVQNLLEVGAGVGAQTEILFERFPHLNITSVDISSAQIDMARTRLHRYVTQGKLQLHELDATDLSPIPDAGYDASFLCWFLEHVQEPLKALRQVKQKLKPGGYVTLTEVNNSSLFIDPYSPNILKYWHEFNDYQWTIKGHPFVGVQLGNYLTEAGFKDVCVEFRPFFFDSRTPLDRKAFMEYFFEIFKSVDDNLVSKGRVHQGMINDVKAEFDHAKDHPRGVFYYSFVRATARA